MERDFQDEEYRYAYAEDFLNTWIATQIVALREQRCLSQLQFGELIGTKQPGVSRLENVNHSTWKSDTLKKIARALGVRLKITFETFGTLLEEDRNFSREYLQRPSFADDPVISGAADKKELTTKKLELAISKLLVVMGDIKSKKQPAGAIAASARPVGNEMRNGAARRMIAAPIEGESGNLAGEMAVWNNSKQSQSQSQLGVVCWKF